MFATLPALPALRAADLWVGLGLLVCACAGSFAIGGWAVDDSWIVLRYVRNILAGHGWVYNIGEQVNGSTSTLNTLVLAGLGLLLRDLQQAQFWTLGCAIGGTAVLWYREASRFGRVPAGMLAVLICASPMPYATLGLESSLVLLTGSGAIFALLRQRWGLAGLGYGLLFLARGDGILLGLPLAIGVVAAHGSVVRAASWKRAWPSGVRLFGIALLTVLPWLIFATVYFGSPVPQTFAAKLAQTSGGAWGEDTFGRWIPFYLGYLDSRQLGLGPLPFAVVTGLAIVAAWRLRRDWPILPLAVGWSSLQCVAYAALQLPRYHWYFTQMLFVTTLGAGVLAVWLWGRPAGTLRWRQGAAVLWCCAWLTVTVVDFATLPNVHYPTYERAAAWLDDHAPRDASIAVMDIGVLGYQVGDRKIVDMCSLVHRDGVAAIAAGDTGWWWRRQPDFIVVHRPVRGIFEQPVLDRPDFAERYEHAADPCSGIRIYRLRGAASAAPR